MVGKSIRRLDCFLFGFRIPNLFALMTAFLCGTSSKLLALRQRKAQLKVFISFSKTVQKEHDKKTYPLQKYGIPNK